MPSNARLELQLLDKIMGLLLLGGIALFEALLSMAVGLPVLVMAICITPDVGDGPVPR